MRDGKEEIPRLAGAVAALRQLLSRIALLLRIPDSHVEGRFVLEAANTRLDALNAEQRRAVEHGVRRNDTVGPPLLIIAGAGSKPTPWLTGLRT